jgi:hypothetical protein
MGDGGNTLQIGHIQLGIADGFGVDGLRFRCNRLFQSVQIVRFHEVDLNSQTGESIVVEVVGPTVEIVHRDNLVARLGNVEERQCDRRLTARHGQGADAAVKKSDSLFENVRRRIHEAGVDVSELLEAEKVRRMVRILELVGRRLINGDGARSRCGVGLLPAVQDQCFYF